MDQESLVQIQQLIAAATDTLHGELVDSNRHAGVLAEGLRHELSLLPKDFRCISTGVTPKIDPSVKRNSEKHAHSSNSMRTIFR